MSARAGSALWTAVLGVVVLLMAGCADDRETALVRVDDNGTTTGVFEPASLVVAPGTEVRWRNVGARTYAVTATREDDRGQDLIPEGAEPWDSGDLSPGETFSHVFEEEGTYVYGSPDHRDQQMIGTIVVAEQ